MAAQVAADLLYEFKILFWIYICLKNHEISL